MNITRNENTRLGFRHIEGSFEGRHFECTFDERTCQAIACRISEVDKTTILGVQDCDYVWSSDDGLLLCNIETTTVASFYNRINHAYKHKVCHA